MRRARTALIIALLSTGVAAGSSAIGFEPHSMSPDQIYADDQAAAYAYHRAESFFDGEPSPNAEGFWREDVQMTVVPEPGTASMVWIGLLGLAVVGSPRDRRKRWMKRTRRSIRRSA